MDRDTAVPPQPHLRGRRRFRVSRLSSRHGSADGRADLERREAVEHGARSFRNRYAALKRLDLARQVYELFVLLCPVVYPVALADTERAKQLVCGGSDVGVRDAIHAAVMLNNDIRDIATFDTGFDLIPEIRRVPLA